jgi:cellulose synthase/poly-beta-1,6-N-acetylglucosamine synthase-like glycosyltransferase
MPNYRYDPLEPGDRLYSPLCQLLVVCIMGYFFYAIPRLRHLLTSIRATYFADIPYLRVAGIPNPGHIGAGKEPHVTVAICAFNEGTVVLKTIDTACTLDWPRNRLTVHVCDDSTDTMSISLIEQHVEYWKCHGVNIERMVRPDRVGYKAGNLRYNFSRVQGEYVAYFDADHRPEKDFLRNTVPYFFDRDGKTISKIALVQTPWAYHNTHQNILTECGEYNMHTHGPAPTDIPCVSLFASFTCPCVLANHTFCSSQNADAFGLDIHHVCEQVGRSINYRLFGFNGTGGIWRRRAIEDAGGFTWETITEDLLLSYRAYMMGYELVYVRHFPQCLEVPAHIQAHIQQKHRWTKGFLQVFRLFRGNLLSPKVPFWVTYEFFSHVLGSIQLVFLSTPQCGVVVKFMGLQGAAHFCGCR